MLYLKNDASKSTNSVKQDKPANVALKLFLSFLLVFSMIPSGLSLQSFADSGSDSVESVADDQYSGDTSGAEESGADSGNEAGSADAPNPDLDSDASHGDPVDSEGSSANVADESAKTVESDSIEDTIQGANMPSLQAISKNLYWSPTTTDITSGSSIVAKAGNDANDGSSADKPVLTWSRLQQLFKDDYGAVNIYVLCPIKPGLKSGSGDGATTVIPDDLTLDGAEDGYSRSVTLFPSGAAASSAIEVDSGKTVHLKNIIVDITGSMAQQSISLAVADNTQDGGNLDIGANVNITGRVIVELNDRGQSVRMDAGKKYLKNPIKFSGEPFKSGTIEVYLRNLNIDEYMGGLIFATSENTENLKNFISLNSNNTGAGFSLMYNGEVDNPDTESAWNKKELVAYKKLECTSLYVDNVNGSDDNTGYTHYSPVKTFEKAKEILLTAPWVESQKVRPITFCNTYTINGDVTWDLSDVALPDGCSTDVRMCEQNNKTDGHTYFRNLITVEKDATFTIKNVILRIFSDVDTTNHDPFVINVNAGGTLNLQSGAIITGEGGTYTQGPAIGVLVSGDATNTTTFNMEDGSTIKNLSQGVRIIGDSSSGLRAKTVFNFNGGTITNNSNYNWRLRRYITSISTGGGGIYSYYSTINMSGNATVSNNESLYDSGYTSYFYSSAGSGIFSTNSDINISGGSIINNSPRSVNYTTNASGTPIGSNWNGAGIYMTSCNFVMSGGDISGNSLANCWENSASSGYGGGIYYSNTSTTAIFKMTGGSIHDNNAANGAGLYLYANSSLPDNIIIKGEDDAKLDFYSNNSSKAYSARNAVASVYVYCASAIIENVKFRDNINAKVVANTGYYNYGSGLYFQIAGGGSGLVDINKCDFENNSIIGDNYSAKGAGLYMSLGNYNSASKYWYKATVQNCTFTGNTITSNSKTGYGGAAFVYNSNYGFVNFSNNTFTNNNAMFGGGLGTEGGAIATANYGTGSAIFRENNVFSGNTSTKEDGNGGDHIYSSGGLTLLGAAFTSTTSDVRPAIYYKAGTSSRRMSVLTSGLTFNGCYGAYLDSISSFISYLDTDTTTIKPFGLNSSALNCVVAKGADNINIPNTNNDGFVSYNIDDVTTDNAYLNSATGFTADNTEIIKYAKSLYIQKKASDATDGIYLDGINGSDNNAGLTTLTAVKTFAKAKEVLKTKIAEANAAGNIFNPYIIVAGTVTLSEDTHISLTADEIGSMSAKAYDPVPTGTTLPAEDKEFFPMIYPEERLTAPMFSVTGGNVTFENVYFEGKSKQTTDSRLNAITQSGGNVTIDGTSRFVDYYCNIITINGSSSVMNIKGQTFFGYSCNSSPYYFIRVDAATLNVQDNVVFYQSGSRQGGNNVSYGITVYNQGNLNVTGNVLFDWSKDLNLTYPICVIDSTVNIGDSDNDTEDSHVSFILNNSIGVYIINGSSNTSSTVNLKGYTSIKGTTPSSGRGISLQNAQEANVNFYDNASVSNLKYGIYVYSTIVSTYNIVFNGNSSVFDCSYGILSNRTGNNLDPFKVNLTLNDYARLAGTNYGIYVEYYNSTYNHTGLFDVKLNDFSEISATNYQAFNSGNAIGHKIRLSGSSKIKRTGSTANTTIILSDSGNVGVRNNGTLEVLDNASIESVGNSYAVNIYSTKEGTYTSKVSLKNNAHVGPINFNNRYTQGSFDLEVLDSATVTSPVDTKDPITTNAKMTLDLTANIDGNIALGDVGYIVLNDTNNSGTQDNKFKLLLTTSKMGTRVIGPGTNITNAADYKSTFKVDDIFVLQEGEGNDANWLVLPADGNVYISGIGSDSNSGLNSGSPVRTFAKAKEVMKTLKKGANFIIAGQVNPVSYGERTWELDEGGTITNNNGEVWTPTIDVSSGFKDTYAICVGALTSTQTMSFKNLTFTHPEDNGVLNSRYLIYINTYSTGTDFNKEGSMVEVSGCNFTNFNLGSSAKILFSYIQTSISQTSFNNINIVGSSSNLIYLSGSYNYESLFSDVTFENNRIETPSISTLGSFIYKHASKLSMNNVSVRNNEFVSTYKGTSNYTIYGPFIYSNNNGSSSESLSVKGLSVVNNSFTKASDTSASLTLTGAGLYSQTYNRSFENCTIDGNTCSEINNAQYSLYVGGAIVDTPLSNVKVTNNQTGGVFVYGTAVMTGGEIGNNTNINNGSGVYSSYFVSLKPKNNAKIADVMYVTNVITVTGFITDPSILYTIYPGTQSAGRIVAKPDGDNIVNIEAFINHFALAKYSGITFELGASEGNIVMKKAIYFGGATSNNNNNGLTPTTAVKTFTQAQVRAKSYNSQGKYINYYMVGAYNSGLASETIDLNSTKTTDGKFTSSIYRYNGQYVPGQVGKTFDAYTGFLFDNVLTDSSLTLTNVSIDGRGDGQPVGSVFFVRGTTTLNLGAGVVIQGGEDLDASTTASIANVVGTLNLNGDAKLYGVNNDGVSTIVQRGVLNLSDTPLIKGDIYVPGDGTDANDKFINVSSNMAPFNNQTISVTVQAPHGGRTVLKYPENYEPTKDDLSYFALDDNTSANYTIGVNGTNKYLVQLTAKNCVYLDPAGGSDNSDGFTADSAKKTLQGAWEAMQNKKGDTGRGGGVVYLVSTLGIDTDTVKIQNVPASSIAPEKSYLTINSDPAVSTDGYVSFRRYVQPTAHASLAGYSKATNTGVVLSVGSNATLSLLNSVGVDGHSKEVTGSAEITAPGYTQTNGSPVEITGNFTINGSNLTNMGANGNAGLAIKSGAGKTVSITDSSITSDVALSDGQYSGAIDVLSKGSVSMSNISIGGNSQYSIMIGTDTTDDALTIGGTNQISAPISFKGRTVPFKLVNTSTKNYVDDAEAPFAVAFNDSYAPARNDKVASYGEGEAPALPIDIKKVMTIDDGTRDKFSLVRDKSNASALILDYPIAIYVNGADAGSDSYDGLTADTAVKTLRHAYELAKEQDAGYILFVGGQTLSGDSYTLSGKSFISGSAEAVNLDREVVYYRYTKPSNSIQGFLSPNFTGVLITVASDATFNMSNLTIDGRSSDMPADINAPSTMITPRLQRVGELVAVSGTANFNEGSVLDNNVGETGTSGGISTVANAIVNINALDVEGISAYGSGLRQFLVAKDANFNINEPEKLVSGIWSQSFYYKEAGACVVFKKAPSSTQEYSVMYGFDPDRDTLMAKYSFDGADAENYKAKFTAYRENGTVPSTLKPDAKYGDPTTLALEDYQDITITKTWSRPNGYDGEHPDSLQLKLANQSTDAGKDTAGDLTVEVSVPTTGEATATHGSVVKSTNASGEDVWTITLKDMPTYEEKGRSSTQINYGLQESQIGGASVDASVWKAQVNKADNKTYTISNTPQRVLKYDHNGGLGRVDNPQVLDYGTAVTVPDRDATLVKEGYLFAGWNTAADGTGTHYNPAQTFALNDNTTLYAMWYKVTASIVTNNVKPGTQEKYEKARRGDVVTVTYIFEVPEVYTSNQLFFNLPRPNDTVDFAGWSSRVSTEFEWEAASDAFTFKLENRVAGTFTVSFDARMKTDFSVNSFDKASVAGTYTFGSLKDQTSTGEIPITDSFKFTYNTNTGTGTAPVDDKYYAPEYDATFTTKDATGLSKAGYYFVGWNTVADGSGGHFRLNTEYSTANLNSDRTYYAMWSKVDMSTRITTDKAKAKPGDVVRFYVDYTLPESVQVAGVGTVTATVRVPDNMTFDSTISIPGSYSDGVVTFTMRASDVGDHRMWFDAKVNEDIVEKGIKSTTTIANASYAGETFSSNSVTVNFTDAYKVTYNINGGTGTAPVDNNYYSAELGEFAYVMTNTQSGTTLFTRPDYTFVGWNTKADGTGVHYHQLGTKFTPTKSENTLYAMWAKYSHSYTIDGGKTKAYRGRTITVTANVQYPESYSVLNATNKLILPVLDGTTYVANSVVKPIGTHVAYADRIEIITNDYSAASYTFSYKLKVTDDASFNANTSISEDVGYEYNADKVGVNMKLEIPVTKSYAIKYDGNTSEAGTVPVDNTFYAPEFGDTMTVIGNTGNLAKTGYAFSGWNTSVDGSGTSYAAGNTINPTADLTLYAQWAHASVTSTNELGHANVRRGETIAYDAMIDVPAPTTTLGFTVTLPDEVEYISDSATPTGVTITGKKLTWSGLTAPKGEFHFKFSAKVSDDKSINDIKSIAISPTFSNAGNDFNVDYSVDVTRSYKAEFSANSGDGDVYYNPSITYISPEYGEKLTIPTDRGADGQPCISKTGYTFNGFNSESDGTGVHYASGSSVALSDDLTAYAEWSPIIYTIKFDKNDDDAKGEMPTISAYYDETVTLPLNIFTKENWGFIGWGQVPEATAETVVYADGSQVVNLTDENGSEVTLYAVWSDDFKTIKFDSMGGTETPDINVATGKTATKPTDPSRLGYNFAGWFTDDESTSEFDWNAAIEEDMTLYAKWTPVTYTVTFRSNGSDEADVVKTLTYDEAFKLEADVFTKANYSFKEWDTESSGAGTSYKGSDQNPQQVELLNLANTQDANVDLYAIWDAGTYTIHFDKNDANATGEMPDQIVKYGEKVRLSKNLFEKPYNEFFGWSTTKDATQATYPDTKTIENLAQAGGSVTLYALWSGGYGYYNIVGFDSMGGSQVPMQYVPNGKKALRPDDPIKTGYVLNYWGDADRNLSPYDFDTIVNRQYVLVAIWTPINYTIHFDINGGNGGNMGDLVATYDTALTLPANTFSRTGYVFKGWQNTKTGQVFNDCETVKNLAEVNDEVVTLSAIWQPNAYEVTFNANGGQGSMPKQSFVYDGEQKLSANAFTRDGFVFAGWSTSAGDTQVVYTDQEPVVNITDKLGETVELYAVWSDNAHSVKFDSNGGTKVSDVNVADGTKVAKPTDPKRKGYTFVGWYLDDALFNFDTTITEDITLTAKWVANSYSVTFNGNSADAGTMSSLNMTYNVAANLSKNAYARTGYSFAGWNTESSGSGISYTDGQSVKNLTDEAGGTVTLYAMWEASNYKVTFDANGGSGSMPDVEMTFDKEMALPANAYQYLGKGFISWNTEKSGGGVKYIDGATVKNLASEAGATVTLYAQWADEGTFKTITFDSNGGSVVLPQNVKTGEITVEPATPTKAGYTFECWFDESDSKFEFGQELTEDITLTARWTANTYTIKFDANGGLGNMPDQTFKFDEAQNLNKNAFTRTGYTFNDWEAEIDGEVVDFADEAEILNLTDKANAVITFKASWTANSYTVKFDSNGGDGEMADQTLVYDVETALVSNKFTKSGFVFGGWNTDASGSGDKYIDGAKVKNLAGEAADVTLYATWIAEADAVLVEFDTGDGTPVLPQYVERGSKLTRPADPTKLGYTFVGWFNGETEYDFDTPVTDSITLSAKWIANTYTVEFAGSGEDDGVMEPMSFTYDVPRKLEKNAYTKENYHFAGWRLNGGTATILNENSGLATFANEPEGDINGDDATDDEQLIPDEAEVMNLTPEQNGQVSMQAVWEADSYTITYMNVEGATNNNPSSYTFGEGVPELQDAYKAGYTFDGWFDNAGLAGDAVTSISAESTGDVVLYAKWTEIANSDVPENPLIPNWIKKLIAGTGDVVPYVVGGVVIVLLAAGGIVLVASRKKKSSDK